MLKASIFKMPEVVELASVTTAGHYIISTHLVRSLTRLDKFGKIQSDLAKSWVGSQDKKTWTLTLGDNHFSNGDPITADHVARSISRQVRLAAGVHFDFKLIKSVKSEGLKTIVIDLVEARNGFIFDLSKPEFGVLHPSDIDMSINKLKLKISSGPYYVGERDKSTYLLKANPHFKERQNSADLTLSDSNGEESAKMLASGGLDFFTSQQNLSVDQHYILTTKSGIRAIKPHIAFSFWLSVNPSSKYFSTIGNRHSFQSIVREFDSKEFGNHTWEKSQQLYLPDGDGRPTQKELNDVWNRIGKVKKLPSKPHLKVIPLKVTNKILEDLRKYLEKYYEVELVTYKSEEELIQLIEAKEFDIKISSNDFSSIDLTENLKTTFNSKRPYVFLDQLSPIKKWMDSVLVSDDSEVKSGYFKKIALELIEKGLVAPVGYQRIWFYYNSNLDLSSWSSIFPEISFWKVKVNDGADK